MHKVLFLGLLASGFLVSARGFGQSVSTSLAENRALFQLHWTRLTTLEDQLPYSINVYLTEDSLHGRPFRAVYIEADPHDMKVDYTISLGSGLTPSAYYQKEPGQPPYVLVNGSWDDPNTHRIRQIAMKDGKILSWQQISIPDSTDKRYPYHYVTPSAIGLTTERKIDVGWVFTDSTKDYPLMMLKGPANPKHSKGERSNPSDLEIHPLNANAEIGAKTMVWPMDLALGGGPTLVKRGQVYISSREELRLNGLEALTDARTAMGCTRGNKLIILVIESGYPESKGATLLEEALMLRDLGCWEALNMSGGPSTSLLINGKPFIRPSGGGEPELGSVFILKSHL